MNKKSNRRKSAAIVLAVLASASLGGCIGQTAQRGYVVSDFALDQVPVGASRDQVLIALGTPSTTANFGNEAYYYISQTTKRPVAFMNHSVVDQRVLTVYFDAEDLVTQIANYGLKDGQVFDFVARTTPTGGRDSSFVGQLLGNIASGAASGTPDQ
jgi:outer membrane protein assembly factor BamE (lipoprotein component of BamABCDE complex)